MHHTVSMYLSKVSDGMQLRVTITTSKRLRCWIFGLLEMVLWSENSLL